MILEAKGARWLCTVYYGFLMSAGYAIDSAALQLVPEDSVEDEKVSNNHAGMLVLSLPFQGYSSYWKDDK